MKKKNPEENSISIKNNRVITKEDVKKITADEFDSVMKKILSAPPQVKKSLKKDKKNE
jgi:hypothetical protein